jgi:hypothetical protein
VEKELVEFVNGRLSDVKHLRGGVIFRDDLPGNTTRKLLRREIDIMGQRTSSNGEISICAILAIKITLEYYDLKKMVVSLVLSTLTIPENTPRRDLKLPHRHVL